MGKCIQEKNYFTFNNQQYFLLKKNAKDFSYLLFKKGGWLVAHS